MESLTRRVEAIVNAAAKPGVEVSFELIGQRPAGKIAASHPLVRLVRRVLHAQGLQPNLTVGSTDANVPLSRGLPAVTMGLSTGFGAHTANEYINTQPLFQGLAQLVEVVEGVFQELA